MTTRKVRPDAPGIQSGKATGRITRQPPTALAGPVRVIRAARAKTPAERGAGATGRYRMTKQQILQLWMKTYGDLTPRQRTAFLSRSELDQIVRYPPSEVRAAVARFKKLDRVGYELAKRPPQR